MWSWLCGSLIYNYQCNQRLSPLTLWVRIPLRRGLLDTTLCDKVCQWLTTGWWFSLGTLVSSTNKTDRHDITEILLKVALNTITPNPLSFKLISDILDGRIKKNPTLYNKTNQIWDYTLNLMLCWVNLFLRDYNFQAPSNENLRNKCSRQKLIICKKKKLLSPWEFFFFYFFLQVIKSCFALLFNSSC